MNNTDIAKIITRALIKAVPFVGGSIDQIIFGIIETLQSSEISAVLNRLQNSINELHVKSLHYNEIEEKILSSVDFKQLQTELKQFKVINIDITQLKRKLNNLLQSFEYQVSDHRLRIESINQKIENLEILTLESFKDIEMLRHFLKIILSDVSIKKKEKYKIDTQYLIPNLNSIISGLTFLIESIGHQRVLQKKYLINTSQIYNLINYPFKELIDKTLFLQYFINKGSGKLHILNSDLHDLVSLKLYILNSRSLSHFQHPPNAIKKLNSFFEDLETLESNKDNVKIREIFEQTITEFKHRMNSRKFEKYRFIKRLVIDIDWCLNLIDSENNLYSTSIEKSKKKKAIFDYIFENFNIETAGTLLDSKKLALLIYLNQTNQNLEAIFISQSVLPKIRSGISSNEMIFESEIELKNFSSGLSRIISILKEFKNDVLLNLKKEMEGIEYSYKEFMNEIESLSESYKIISDTILDEAIKRLQVTIDDDGITPSS